ncbi:hypothetical protein O181_083493 [Austropuccinia psidii MF-1]|uniref:protein-serine/threonine phosphatase n=1 Tax=Austropuccinia psidii MF-1 TaxID=1389203 RepID=A0A9Q3FTS2_9BASI|nr:hypothetical protein [Austropuccinia psidii MF-1]
MGQTLSEPVIEKHTTTGQDERFAFGVSEMQGWRLTMEDAHSAVLDLDAAQPNLSSTPSQPQNPHNRTSFFAVYDGHGGSTVAKFSGDTVHFRLRSTSEYQNQDYPAALKRAFLATDEDLRSNPDFNNDPSGCTAVAALITPDGRILVANAGDSRSVLCVNGVAKAMSEDHKPVNRIENNRIVAAGGFVEFGRVNGNLALSRAIGDFEFKQNKKLTPEEQVVTADPDILTHQITSEDEFLILACDGIWDVYSNQQVVDRVRRLIGERKSLERIAEQMIENSLAPDCEWGGVGCDNMTFMIVAILGGKTKEQWYDMICERLNRGEGHQTPSTFPDPYAQSARVPLGSGPLIGSSLNVDESVAPPPTYHLSEEANQNNQSAEAKQNSVGSLFSLAPASIIEVLSRVSQSAERSPPSNNHTSNSSPPPSSTNVSVSSSSSSATATANETSDEPDSNDSKQLTPNVTDT